MEYLSWKTNPISDIHLVRWGRLFHPVAFLFFMFQIESITGKKLEYVKCTSFKSTAWLLEKEQSEFYQNHYYEKQKY